MDEVKTNMWSPTLKSYLRLYTTMDLNKLAGFLDGGARGAQRSWLLVNKPARPRSCAGRTRSLEGDLAYRQ